MGGDSDGSVLIVVYNIVTIRRDFMKKHISIMLLLTLILIPSIILAKEDKDLKDKKVNKIVTVGYSLKDKEKIFGDKSLDEIDQILKQKCEEIMEDDSKYKVKMNADNFIDEDLIISVYYPKRDLSKDDLTTNLYSKSNILPLGNSFHEIRDRFRYTVGFDVGDMGGAAYGGYQSNLRGSYSDVHQQGVIDSLNTYHIEGAYYPVKDYAFGKSNAYNVFSQPYDIGRITLGRGDFNVVSGGRIIFSGIR